MTILLLCKSNVLKDIVSLATLFLRKQIHTHLCGQRACAVACHITSHNKTLTCSTIHWAPCDHSVVWKEKKVLAFVYYRANESLQNTFVMSVCKRFV